MRRTTKKSTCNCVSDEAAARYGLDLAAFSTYERTGSFPWTAITQSFYHALHAELLGNGLNYQVAAERLGVSRRLVEMVADADRVVQPKDQAMASKIPPLRPLILERLQANISSSVIVPDAATESMQKKAERAKELQAEAEKISGDMLRVARRNVLGGMVNLATITPGLQKMAERMVARLADGGDIEPTQALAMLDRFASSAAKLVNAARTIVEVDRLQRELPTAIITYEVSGITLQSAEKELNRATKALQNARRLGLALVKNEEKKVG